VSSTRSGYDQSVRWTSSVFRVLLKISATALSHQCPCGSCCSHARLAEGLAVVISGVMGAAIEVKDESLVERLAMPGRPQRAAAGLCPDSASLVQFLGALTVKPCANCVAHSDISRS
jgi:hypothetical protein